jgi:hypothetical protein
MMTRGTALKLMKNPVMSGFRLEAPRTAPVISFVAPLTTMRQIPGALCRKFGGTSWTGSAA